MKKAMILLLFLFLTLMVHAQEALIEGKRIEHNVIKDGVNGLKIHLDCFFLRCKGQKLKAIVYFQQPKGTCLKSKNTKYSNKNGDVCASAIITPSKDISRFKDISIFMPLDAINMKKGKLTYYCDIKIIHLATGKIINRDSYLTFVGTQYDNSNNNQYAKGNSTPMQNEKPSELEKVLTNFMLKELLGVGMSDDSNGGEKCVSCGGSGIGNDGSACSTCHGRGVIIKGAVND